MPFGLLAAFPGRLVAPGIGCCEPQIGDWPTILSATDFRIGAQIADQNDLVHASCHRPTPLAACIISASGARIAPPAGSRNPRFTTLVPCQQSATAKLVFHTRSSFIGAETSGSCFVLETFYQRYKPS